MGTPADSIHSEHSTLREMIVEHLFVGKALQALWRRKVFDVEILRSETDSFGYDLVVSRGELVRHVQLKTSKIDGKTKKQKVMLNLAEKPSGCVIWIRVDDRLEFDSFLWLGGEPGSPLPAIEGMKVAKHSKGNREGTKNPRVMLREVAKGSFDPIDTLEKLLAKIFGRLPL